MIIILKRLFAPIMLVLWVIECAGKLALKLSSVVFVIAATLFFLAGVLYFTNGFPQNGFICLGIAFLISPYGLPMLATKLLARFIVIRMILSEKIYG